MIFALSLKLHQAYSAIAIVNFSGMLVFSQTKKHLFGGSAK